MPGHVDLITRTEIRGWAIKNGEKVGDVVSISIDEEEIAQVSACLSSRHHEEVLGVAKCVFSFSFPEALAISGPAKVTVRSASTGALLGNGEHWMAALYSEPQFRDILGRFGCVAHPLEIAFEEEGIAVRGKVLSTAGAELALLPLASPFIPGDSACPSPTNVEFRTMASTGMVTTSEVRFVLPRSPDSAVKMAAVRVSDLRVGGGENWGQSIDDFAASMSVPFSFDWLTLPPKENYTRTTGDVPIEQFALGGVSCAGVLFLIARHFLGHGISRVLDWGVGCGRVAVPLKRAFLNTVDMLGVDVDNVNVDWCKLNLPDVKAELGDFYPPLDIRSDSIDLIYGMSVMTHLTRDLQAVWLRELRRILRPGGICILTTHGQYALAVAQRPHHVYREIERIGISDGSIDLALGPKLAVREYYRGTFQLRSQVEKEWSRYMSIVGYLPAGSHAHQDMVILRKE